MGAAMDLVQDILGGPTDPAFLSVVAVTGIVLGLVLGHHRLGMAMMPISSALCWSCLFFWPTNYQQFGVLLPCCGFFWGWACKNRLLGPIRTDGGVFTFLPGVLAGVLATLPGAPMHPTPWRGGFYVAATLLPALNFLVPVRHFAASRPQLAQISERHGKPPPFGAVFVGFCCSQLAFFPLAAAHFGRACRLGLPAVLVALCLTAATPHCGTRRPGSGKGPATHGPPTCHIRATYGPPMGHLRATYEAPTGHLRTAYGPPTGHLRLVWAWRPFGPRSRGDPLAIP